MDLEVLRSNLAGNMTTIETPYGIKQCLYGDFTASGKEIYFVQNYLQEVAEKYANTHTGDSAFGRFTTEIYHTARHAIKENIGAGKDHSLIMTGSGTTGAILKLVQILGLYEAPATRARQTVRPYDQVPLVFVGPYEHHSNELIWRETIAEVIEIGLDESGLFSLEDLRVKVKAARDQNREIYGAFSAASNVTGKISPIQEIEAIMHAAGGKVFFDYAASAPYEPLKMTLEGGGYLDGLYFSPHKFVGGPGAAGVLVIRNDLYKGHLAPTCAGGGTVTYVSADDYDFKNDIEEREDGGTPPILQTLRTALALQIKRSIGTDRIKAIEEKYIDRAMTILGKHEQIKIIGPGGAHNRLGILSFNVLRGDHYLHPRFITTLLNDLFGIQSRAGCSCAGPYGHWLLGIDPKHSQAYRQIVNRGGEAMKPGWVRVNFHYLLESFQVSYLIQAIEFVADFGHLYLCDYQVDRESGDWHHLKNKVRPGDRVDLDIDLILQKGLRVTKAYDALYLKDRLQAQLEEARLDVEERRLHQSPLKLELYGKALYGDLAWFYTV